MRRPTFKCSQYTAPTFPIQLQYGTFGTGVATAQKFAQVWLQAGYDQKKCGNCCTSFPKIHCGSRWFWVLLENKKLQGSVVMSVSTTTQEYNCFDKHLNTSLLRKLWQPWLLGKPHWNSCCAPNHPGKGLDPPSNQANAHLILANSSLKKCPKPSGQGFRPPPQTGNAHMEVLTSWKGLPLVMLLDDFLQNHKDFWANISKQKISISKLKLEKLEKGNSWHLRNGEAWSCLVVGSNGIRTSIKSSN